MSGIGAAVTPLAGSTGMLEAGAGGPMIDVSATCGSAGFGLEGFPSSAPAGTTATSGPAAGAADAATAETLSKIGAGGFSETACGLTAATGFSAAADGFSAGTAAFSAAAGLSAGAVAIGATAGAAATGGVGGGLAWAGAAGAVAGFDVAPTGIWACFAMAPVTESRLCSSVVTRE